MKNQLRTFGILAAFAILFLFLVQAVTTFVESIYILDLMNTSLDEKAAGVLFFFSPVMLFLIDRQRSRTVGWVCLFILVVGRGLLPYLDTAGRLLAGGMAAGAGLVLLPLWLTTTQEVVDDHAWLAPAQGLALGAVASTLQRSMYGSLDISLAGTGSILGWLEAVGLVLLYLICKPVDRFDRSWETDNRTNKKLAPAMAGTACILALSHFVFFSPGVLARWADANYPLTTSLASGMALGYLVFSLWQPGRLAKISPGLVLCWNVAFAFAIGAAAIINTPIFPQDPTNAAQVAFPAGIWQQGFLWLAILLSPIIYHDLAIFGAVLVEQKPAPRQLAGGFLWGIFLWVVMIFLNIFSNVWGYVDPVSTPWRGKYWLPFFILAGLAGWLAWQTERGNPGRPASGTAITKKTGIALAAASIGIAGFILFLTLSGEPHARPPDGKQSLVVMTYNIQEANDGRAQRSYDRQLALIRKINPDILALQESDSARISLGNNDYVRFYASQLGYFSYYGPPTPAGTFGTALLSRYPLENPAVIYSFSDSDEIGTTRAEIMLNGKKLKIFDVHPDGSPAADEAFARALIEQVNISGTAIALGDFNLRQSEPAYQQIAHVLVNAWLQVYPSGINPQGLDMSGDKRIDHIFLSPDLTAINAFYLPPPESATDHPAHWAEIRWK